MDRFLAYLPVIGYHIWYMLFLALLGVAFYRIIRDSVKKKSQVSMTALFIFAFAVFPWILAILVIKYDIDILFLILMVYMTLVILGLLVFSIVSFIKNNFMTKKG